MVQSFLLSLLELCSLQEATCRINATSCQPVRVTACSFQRHVLFCSHFALLLVGKRGLLFAWLFFQLSWKENSVPLWVVSLRHAESLGWSVPWHAFHFLNAVKRPECFPSANVGKVATGTGVSWLEQETVITVYSHVSHQEHFWHTIHMKDALSIFQCWVFVLV